MTMINPTEEKKLGRIILETMNEIAATPHDNVRRFLIVERRLKRAVKAYRDYTGSDYLLGTSPAHYGMEAPRGATHTELINQENKRRNGNLPE